MVEVPSLELQQASESQNGGTASFVQSVPVHEEFEGKPVWNGTVHIFDHSDSLSGTTRAYARSYERDDGRRRFFAIPHLPRWIPPAKADRAAIVAEARAR